MERGRKKRERGQSPEKRAPAKKSQQRERDRATFTVFFYPFLDHVTETQM